jgi:transposase-like protein
MQKRMQSREWKLDSVRQVSTGQKRPAQACREYGSGESVLSHWRKEYQERGEAAFQPTHAEGAPTQEQKVAEREPFCGQRALENQILQKTFQRVEWRSVTR